MDETQAPISQELQDTIPAGAVPPVGGNDDLLKKADAIEYQTP